MAGTSCCEDVYEHLQIFPRFDDSEPDPREFYPAFFKAVNDNLDAPGMEE
jgi:hypothetical protein